MISSRKMKLEGAKEIDITSMFNVLFIPDKKGAAVTAP